VGFLKFLKRDRKDEDSDELDLPPPPPDDADIELPEFPDIDKPYNLDEDLPKIDLGSGFKDDSENDQGDYGAEDISKIAGNVDVEPAYEEPEQSAAAMPAPLPPEPQIETPAPQPRLEGFAKRAGFLSPESVFRQRPSGKTIYVKVENFKGILGNINTVRSDFRNLEAAAVKLENMKLTRESSLGKIKSSLQDLQRKLIFIDKTLFKGE